MTAPATPVCPGHRFSKQDRLLRRAEFLAVQAQGRRVHTPHFVLILRNRGDEGPARLGLTTSRKSANAVGRNRIRRLLREVFRTERAAFPLGHDCVVIAREKLPELSLAVVRAELLDALARRSRQRPPPGQTGPADAKQGHPPAARPRPGA
jgi:ribonuclease P protein component